MPYRQENTPANKSRVKMQPCAWPDCCLAGEHKAPISKDNMMEYQYFCLEHIRVFNKAWNYYDGMSDLQVESEVRSDAVWNRPTWPMGSDNGIEEARLRSRFAFENVYDGFGLFTGETSNSNIALEQLSAKERTAISILGVDYPIKKDELKHRYKALVKRHHPDANGGDKKAEERFKKIHEAYETIVSVLNTER